jgi:hypothetical protein
MYLTLITIGSKTEMATMSFMTQPSEIDRFTSKLRDSS